mgnify:CR=1 FL=1
MSKQDNTSHQIQDAFAQKFGEWLKREQSSRLIADLQGMEKEELVMLSAYLMFLAEMMYPARSEILEQVEKSSSEDMRLGTLAAYLHEWPNLRAAVTQRENLAKGRPRGTAKNQELAKDKRQKLDKAIRDYLAAPGHAHQRTETIAEFITSRFKKYKFGTVKRHVETVRADLRRQQK